MKSFFEPKNHAKRKIKKMGDIINEISAIESNFFEGNEENIMPQIQKLIDQAKIEAQGRNDQDLVQLLSQEKGGRLLILDLRELYDAMEDIASQTPDDFLNNWKNRNTP